MGRSSSNSSINEKKTDRYLNALVAVSSCIVALLVFDQMESMLLPYMSMVTITTDYSLSINTNNLATHANQDATSLSQNCSNTWKKEQSGRSAVSTTSNRPTYSEQGFCSLIPANLSAAHLWNEHLQWIWEASASSSDEKDNVAGHLETSRLLQFLTPSQYLDIATRAQPSRRPWGALLKKIHARMTFVEAPIVTIVVFGSVDHYCIGDQENSECLWPMRLESLINNFFNTHSAEKRPIVKVVPIHPPTVAVTKEWDTAIVRQGLWKDQLQGQQQPDVIISTFTSQDMYLPKRGWDTANDIDYNHHQRRIIQAFMRACLDLQPCPDQPPPVLISLDDYVVGHGNNNNLPNHGPVIAEITQARVLQLLSDYYETAFVSYAEVIRKLVYASQDLSSPLLHSTSNNKEDWTLASLARTLTTTAASNNNNNQQEQGLAPIAMTLTLAYSFLKYTVHFCSDQATGSLHDQENPLMKQVVRQLAETVPPPELNTDLCLSNITKFWQEEQQQRQGQCGKGKPKAECPLAFWGEQQQDLDAYLANFVSEKQGWEMQTGGRLVATQKGATVSFTIPVPTATQDPNKRWSIQLFSTVKDSVAASVASKLKWEVSASGKRRRSRRRLEEQQQNATSSGKSGIIEGTHDSPHTVALPTTMWVDELHGLVPSHVDLKLELVEGNEFEIVAMMFCSSHSSSSPKN